MCGLIAAQLNRPWLSPELLNKALNVISHRGPDGSSSWISPNGLTALGHVRLSIIGINNGRQPLKDAQERLHAVVNGEFYGYRVIRQSLREKGYRFLTETDSEIAVHLYDEYGARFVDHLRGEFALVIADRRSGELIAARDRFGIKPLFYAVINGDVLFASEAKALLALGVTARWDRTGVLEDFAGTRTNRSLFANILQVPPGCFAVAKDGRVRIEQYWDNVYPTAAALALDNRDDTDVVAGFRNLFDDAVRERLAADVEVACYLSGGIDSSATLGVAQTHQTRPIRAFTIMFDGEQYDESPLAERTAAFTGSEYVPVRVSARDMADALEESVWHGERPFFNANVTAKFLLSKAVRAAGIKVVLTGEGADEMLAGYQTEQRDQIMNDRTAKGGLRGRRAAMASLLSNPAVRAFMFHRGKHAPGVDVFQAALGYRPSFLEGFSIQFRSVFELMRKDMPDYSDTSIPYAGMLKAMDIPGRLTGRDAVNQSLFLWQKSMLVNYVLTVLGDRMEMSNSVEGRVPFLDHKVAEYSAALPIRFKIRGGVEKYILREAARDVITPELYARHKHPFFAPPLRQATQNTVPDPLRVVCEDVIRSASFADQPFFDPIRARAFLDKAAKGKIPAEVAAAATMRMATLSIMQKKFCVA